MINKIIPIGLILFGGWNLYWINFHNSAGTPTVTPIPSYLMIIGGIYFLIH